MLVLRGKSPGKGKWSFCGGSIVLGEDTIVAAYRELQEETGLSEHNVRLSKKTFGSSDSIAYDSAGNVQFHYVIQHVYGVAAADANAKASDDAESVGWYTLPEMIDLKLSFAGNIVGIVQDVEKIHSSGAEFILWDSYHNLVRI